MTQHIPVLYHQSLEGLNIKPHGIYIDCTLGRGGHSLGILAHLTTGRLIGLDQDEQAIKEASENLKAYLEKITLVHDNFRNIKAIMNDLSISSVDGILMDLGVSSPQFDDPERGFSYRYDARLDMRMDRRQAIDAFYVVNSYPYERLVQILLSYGEEPYAKQIARAIEKQRSLTPIETTFQLVDVIKSALPSKVLSQKGHPAKQVFQALRIEVNQELSILEGTLRDAISLLNHDGRLAVITFHSLEDRIVKKVFAEMSRVNVPSKLPVLGTPKADYELIDKKHSRANETELLENPRAHSAKLRILRKV
ncbi:MAG: 16S rRNA (cytosine(1402)-N(4))-methyltransferase RsmH [Erysipelotrichaceae bacterium]|nr:16S rRNA (cytosine(1402)-N(4))-methyltransferase RsmH [Erysipelotrichaceae bacterium]